MQQPVERRVVGKASRFARLDFLPSLGEGLPLTQRLTPGLRRPSVEQPSGCYRLVNVMALELVRAQVYDLVHLQQIASERFGEANTQRLVAYAKALIDNDLPVVFDGFHLSYYVGLKANYLYGISNAASYYYRKFRIAKRSGGFRSISEPLPTLKKAQNWLLLNIFSKVPSSKFCYSYIRGKSIKKMANIHRAQRYIYRIDIKKYFERINKRLVFKLLCN